MSFHVEFHPPGLPGTGQKVCGGGGGWVVVCKPILVFSFGQAEQKSYTYPFRGFDSTTGEEERERK